MLCLAIDLGTNSIGWAAIEDNERFFGLGVRIFSDGRSADKQAPLNEERRLARSASRRRDRFVRRRSSLMTALVAYGLMPDNEQQAKKIARQNPYNLRAQGLDAPLSPYEMGRALFHLNQRRGFKSNRKVDRKDKDESGLVQKGGKKLDEAMEATGSRSLGEFLYHQKSQRVRKNSENAEYDFYPQRRHYEEEFELLWTTQKHYMPALLTDEAKDKLYHIIFDQRPLKAPIVGKCSFYPSEERLAKSHPLFQIRCLYATLNHLKLEEEVGESRSLTLEERDRLFDALRQKEKMTFAAVRKLLSLSPTCQFSTEKKECSSLTGDVVFSALSKKNCFGKRWAQFSIAEQWALIQLLQNEEDPNRLLDILRKDYQLDDDQAHAVMELQLPSGYGHIGETATRELVERFKEEVISYAQAAQCCGGHHSHNNAAGDVYDVLPYYGEVLREAVVSSGNESDPLERRFGKLSNPTVHNGLRQLEKLVNEFIRTYGKPDKVILEIARDLSNSQKQKDKISKEQNKNRKEAEKRGERLKGLNIKNTGANRARLKLWEDTNEDPFQRCCLYCGNSISVEELFSDNIEIDHILPYSRTLDDRAANKLVVHRACNRKKGDKTPAERWKGETIWEEKILPLVAGLPGNKRWRFQENAMDSFEKEENGFMVRQLKDTQYLSRASAQYLNVLYPRGKGNKQHVYVVPGRLTALLRREWGLNSLLDHSSMSKEFHKYAAKNRLDHRHHAIDAAVVGVTTLGTVQKMVRASKRAEDRGQSRLFCELETPWEGFREDLGKALQRVTVSHKIDHGYDRKNASKHRDTTSAALFKETAYGPTGIKGKKKGHELLVTRKPFLSLTEQKNVDGIADPTLKRIVQERTQNLSKEEKLNALKALQTEEGPFKNIKRVRVLRDFDLAKVKPIKGPSGKVEKIYPPAGNHSAIIWRMPNGKWVDQIVPIYDAKKESAELRPHPAAKKIMELHKNDMVAIEDSGIVRKMRVQTITKGKIYLVEHYEAGKFAERDKARKNGEDYFEYKSRSASVLQKEKTRKIRVNILGVVTDGGFRL